MFNVLLQVLDDGRLTDGQGRTVDFKNTLIIMTSNIGSDYLANQKEGEDIGGRAALRDGGAARPSSGPEFLNRIDEIILFHRLKREQMAAIVDIQIGRLQKLLVDRKLTLELDDAARTWLANKGYDPTYGARPLKRVIQKTGAGPAGRADPRRQDQGRPEGEGDGQRRPAGRQRAAGEGCGVGSLSHEAERGTSIHLEPTDDRCLAARRRLDDHHLAEAGLTPVSALMTMPWVTKRTRVLPSRSRQIGFEGFDLALLLLAAADGVAERRNGSASLPIGQLRRLLAAAPGDW